MPTSQLEQHLATIESTDFRARVGLASRLDHYVRLIRTYPPFQSANEVLGHHPDLYTRAFDKACAALLTDTPEPFAHPNEDVLCAYLLLLQPNPVLGPQFAKRVLEHATRLGWAARIAKAVVLYQVAKEAESRKCVEDVRRHTLAPTHLSERTIYEPPAAVIAGAQAADILVAMTPSTHVRDEPQPGPSRRDMIRRLQDARPSADVLAAFAS